MDDYFSIQSTSKVVTFATALAEVGEKEILSYVGAYQRGHRVYDLAACAVAKLLQMRFLRSLQTKSFLGGAILNVPDLYSGQHAETWYYPWLRHIYRD